MPKTLTRMYAALSKAIGFLPSVPRNLLVTLLFLCIAYVVSSILLGHTGAENNSALVFVLAVVCISSLTDGYAYGIAASLVGGFCINYYFMFPYRAFSLSYAGYPVAMVSMVAISSVVCALTSRVKLQAIEAIKREQNTKTLYELNARLNEEKNAIQLEADREAIRGNILRAVSHDLRTPLTSILGYLQLLEDPGLTEGERREYLAVIAGRARTLQSLITSFYDLSRLEGGEYLLQREKVDLYASLSGLLAAFYNDFTDRGFDMEVELAEGLPQVWADAGAVLRIFTNLIRNALEHGEGRMEIRLYQEGGQVVSRFSNETHALTAEDVPHVFDRFFTSDKMRTGRNTGLGLAIVKALAGQMDCRAEAALEGDMFAITLRWPVERR